MLIDEPLLSTLLADVYGLKGTLSPVLNVQVDGREIARCQAEDGTTWLIRAYRRDHADLDRALERRARILSVLERLGYPAPRLRPTQSGAMIGVWGGWSVLLLTFVDGVPLPDEPFAMRALGAALGHLHQVTSTITTAVSPAAWSVDAIAVRYRDLLATSSPIADLADLHHGARAMFGVFAAARALPTALLHGDPWPRNALLLPDGTAALIDWDNAGRGTAILDLGYLLHTCHLLRPQVPVFQLDPAVMREVLRGYLGRRSLTPAEAAALPDALRFGVATLYARPERVATRTGRRSLAPKAPGALGGCRDCGYYPASIGVLQGMELEARRLTGAEPRVLPPRL
jgi:Ser/Thr protein kinase RdoA (MazF antagonist)